MQKKPSKVTPHGIQPMNFPPKRLEELRVRELEVEQSMRSEQQRKTYLEEEAQQVIEGTGRVESFESIKECLFAVASLEVYKNLLLLLNEGLILMHILHESMNLKERCVLRFTFWISQLHFAQKETIKSCHFHRMWICWQRCFMPSGGHVRMM